MDKSHYSLTWDKFHSNMCTGFSLLQQNGELVDLTLAAEGKLVKVHQIVLGIASPYIKELIQSADCKHPVIFMNNMSYKMLCSILEYVYTGEVLIEEECLGAFMETARTLQITGLEGMNPKVEPGFDDSSKLSPVKKFRIEIMGNKRAKLTEELHLPDAARNVKIKQKKPYLSFSGCETKLNETSYTPAKRLIADDVGVDTDIQNDSDRDFEMSDNGGESGTEEVNKDNDNDTVPKIDLKYTVSNKGSLQLILNRYMYNLRNYKAGPVRRWRCVDSKERRCTATALTENDLVVRRTSMHNHPYHDRRILTKIKKQAVFSAIRTTENKLEIKPSEQAFGT